MDTSKISRSQLISAAFFTGLLIGLIIGIVTGQTQEEVKNPTPSEEESLSEPYPTLEDSSGCPEMTSCKSQTPYNYGELPSGKWPTPQVQA